MDYCIYSVPKANRGLSPVGQANNTNNNVSMTQPHFDQ